MNATRAAVTVVLMLWLAPFGCNAPENGGRPKLIETGKKDTHGPGSDSDSGDVLVGPDGVQSACDTDADCKTGHEVCDPNSGKCVQCNYPGDCSDQNVLCVKHVCQKLTPCQSDKQCLDQGAVCNKKTGLCVDCIEDVECGEGEHCRANHCMPIPKNCKTSKDCNELGRVCNKTIGKCVDCEDHLDCDQTEHCFEGVCVPDLCQPAKTKCNNEGAKLTCSKEGSAWTVTGCGKGSICKDGTCAGTACSPGTSKCSGNSIAKCESDGSGWLIQSCSANKKCVPGDGTPAKCVPVVCKAGSTFCDGAKVIACSADGTSEIEKADCSKQSVDGKLQTCVAGKCEPKACKPGSAVCDGGDGLATCKQDGSGYLKTKCGSGKPHCVASICVLCKPGTLSCAPPGRSGESTVVLKCDGSGNDYEIETSCTSGQICKVDKCVLKSVCQPGQTKCDGDKLSTCATDASGWATSSCGTGKACTAGKCVPVAICKAGETKCTANSLATCNIDGMSWTTKTCGDSNACTTDSCPSGTTTCVNKPLADGASCGGSKKCKSGKCMTGLGTKDQPAASCKAILAVEGKANSGVYWLSSMKKSFRAWCDMKTDGGGWTVFAHYRFSDGPDFVQGAHAKDGTAWRTDYNLDKIGVASHWQRWSKFHNSKVLNSTSEFMVRSGNLSVAGKGLSLAVSPSKGMVHTVQGTVNIAGKKYRLTSACSNGCCGSYTAKWDTLVLVGNWSPNHADASTQGNAPAIGWIDHNCNIDGHATTPAWKMEHGGLGKKTQQFSEDLWFQFR